MSSVASHINPTQRRREQFASKIAETESWKFSANSGDFKELCRWSCATRDHELGGMANRLSALGVADSTVGFEALPQPP